MPLQPFKEIATTVKAVRLAVSASQTYRERAKRRQTRLDAAAR